ncbi:MAG: DUF4386 domain-containing protein [Anaerolineales bacterium]
MNTNENVARFTDISLRTAAMVAGVGLLLMAILSPFAFLNTYQNIMVSGDAKATADNIIASGNLFNIGISIFLVVAILDIVVAWALYVLFKPVNKSLSLLAAWFRLAYAPIFALALTNLFSASQLLSGADYLKAFETNQLYAQAMLSVSAFKNGWDIGLVIFGLHLLVLGYLAFKSGFIPKWLGILLVVASIGYMADSFGRFLSPDYNISLAQFTFVGEALLIFWLLWRGIKGFDKESKTS